MPPHLLTSTSSVGGKLLLLLKKCPVEVSGHSHDLIVTRADASLYRPKTPDLVPYCPLAMGLEKLFAHSVARPSPIGEGSVVRELRAPLECLLKQSPDSKALDLELYDC